MFITETKNDVKISGASRISRVVKYGVAKQQTTPPAAPFQKQLFTFGIGSMNECRNKGREKDNPSQCLAIIAQRLEYAELSIFEDMWSP